MARGELLRRLFLSYQRGSEEGFHSAALEIIAEEERKSNHRLAKDLLRILENGGTQVSSAPVAAFRGGSPPRDHERQTSLVDVRHPTRHFEDIILGKDASDAVGRVLQEYRSAELLHLHGLSPATKLLFCGPPGCGKTLCAEIIATELGLPLLYTRFDAIVSSYLGETAANLRKLFDYASSGRWVILFDEFDAIGKARDNPTEHGELKRVINSFLQLLDGFDAPSIVIAATNHEQMLDPALWRRFDEVVVFPRPSVHDTRALLHQKLKNFPRTGIDLRSAAVQLKGMSHADIERVCFDAIKHAILSGKDAVDRAIFDRSVNQQRARLRVSQNAARQGGTS